MRVIIELSNIMYIIRNIACKIQFSKIFTKILTEACRCTPINLPVQIIVIRRISKSPTNIRKFVISKANTNNFGTRNSVDISHIAKSSKEKNRTRTPIIQSTPYMIRRTKFITVLSDNVSDTFFDFMSR